MNKLPQHIKKSFDKIFTKNYLSANLFGKILIDFESFIATILEEERKRIIDKYGYFNDGCGCCARNNLGNELEQPKDEKCVKCGANTRKWFDHQVHTGFSCDTCGYFISKDEINN